MWTWSCGHLFICDVVTSTLDTLHNGNGMHTCISTAGVYCVRALTIPCDRLRNTELLYIVFDVITVFRGQSRSGLLAYWGVASDFWKVMSLISLTELFGVPLWSCAMYQGWYSRSFASIEKCQRLLSCIWSTWTGLESYIRTTVMITGGPRQDLLYLW